MHGAFKDAFVEGTVDHGVLKSVTLPRAYLDKYTATYEFE